MADAIIQLPFVGTTSGDILDASSVVVGAQTVKCERMVIGNDTSSHVAIVTTSGALSVSRTPTSLTSGLITLTGANVVTNASSGLTQISGPITSASSGFVQVYQSTAPWLAALSSGTVTLTNPSTAVNLVGSTNGLAVVTSSGALSVTMSTAGGGAGSTAINLPTVSAAGFAPVTSSYGLLVDQTPHLFTQIVSTVGAPVFTLLTSNPARLYSVAIVSSQVTSQGIEIYNSTTTVLTGPASTFLSAFSVAAANSYLQVLQAVGGGISCTGGLGFVGRLTLGTTASMTAQIRTNIEYAV